MGCACWQISLTKQRAGSKSLDCAPVNSYGDWMKHLTFSDKSLLVDDATADAVIEYAALLSQNQTGDAVDIHAFSSDGDEVEAKILLGPGASIMAETAHTSLTEPDNAEALAYIEQKTAALSARPLALVDDDPSDGQYSEMDL